MAKYKCLCGMKFKKEELAEEHGRFHQIFKSDDKTHLILTLTRSGSFWDWFWNYPWAKTFRFVGAYMIYFVVIRHFNIEWGIWEACLIGLGMGLYID